MDVFYGAGIKRFIARATSLFFSICELFSGLSVVLLYVFLRPRIIYPAGYKQPPEIPRGALIIANHQSRLDPFFIMYHLGLKNILRNIPFRFPVTSSYMRNPFLGLPLHCLGCFDMGETPFEKARGLLHIRNLLRHTKTVVLFPEGKITRNMPTPAVFERGVNFLIGHTTPVFLVRLTGMSTWSFFNITDRYQTQIRFSEVLPPGMAAHEKFVRMQEFFEKAESIL